MAEFVGEALLPLGIASLSIDLPLHGDRADPFELRSVRDPSSWPRDGERRSRKLNSPCASSPRAERSIANDSRVIGYSLGAYLSLAVAERDRAPRAVVLAAGGDLPDFPLAPLIRAVADPIRGVRALDWPAVAHGARPAGSDHPSRTGRAIVCGGAGAEGDPVVGRRSLPPGAAVRDSGAVARRTLRSVGSVSCVTVASQRASRLA